MCIELLTFSEPRYYIIIFLDGNKKKLLKTKNPKRPKTIKNPTPKKIDMRKKTSKRPKRPTTSRTIQTRSRTAAEAARKENKAQRKTTRQPPKTKKPKKEPTKEDRKEPKEKTPKKVQISLPIVKIKQYEVNLPIARAPSTTEATASSTDDVAAASGEDKDEGSAEETTQRPRAATDRLVNKQIQSLIKSSSVMIFKKLFYFMHFRFIK